MNADNSTPVLPIPPEVTDKAACAGRWAIFDPKRHGETREAVQDRWKAAQDICATCPVLAQCAHWYQSIPPGEPRPEGVVAGVVRSVLVGRPPNRPRTASLASSVHAGAQSPVPRTDGARNPLEVATDRRRHRLEVAVA